MFKLNTEGRTKLMFQIGTSSFTHGGGRKTVWRNWPALCAFLLAVAAFPVTAAIENKIPVVDPFFMLSGALLKDSFDGPQLDSTLWSRPSWLVENHKTIGVKVEQGHLVISAHRIRRSNNISMRA